MPAPAAVNDEAMYPTATMSVPGREQIATPGAHSASTTSAPLYDGESTTLTHSKGQMPAVHAPRRRRVWPWLLVFALVLAVGGGLTYWSLWRSEQQHSNRSKD